MSEKITMQVLSDVLADRNGATKKFSENFLKAFFDTLTDGLATEGIVRVKGLGAFKLVEVGERESVSVSTGERFLIPGYKKVNFIPEDSFNTSISFKSVSDADESVSPELCENSDVADDIVCESSESVNQMNLLVEDRVTVGDQVDKEVLVDNNDDKHAINNFAVEVSNGDSAFDDKEETEVVGNEQEGKDACELETLLNEEVETPEAIERKSDDFSGIDLLISTPESIEGVKEDLWRAKNTMLTLHAKAEQAIKAAKEAKREVLRLERLVEHLESNKSLEPIKQDEASTGVPQTFVGEVRQNASEECGLVDLPTDDSVAVVPNSDDEDVMALEHKSNSRHYIVVVLIVMAVIVLVGLGVYFLLFNNNNETLNKVKLDDVEEKATLVTVNDTIATDTVLIGTSDSLSTAVVGVMPQDTVLQSHTVNTNEDLDDGQGAKAENATDADDKRQQMEGIEERNADNLIGRTEQVEKNEVPVEPVPKTYTMKVGDTLTKLARRFYGSPSYVVEIINANNFPDPNNVPVGAVVIMPEITQH